jgi:hypothetical protein
MFAFGTRAGDQYCIHYSLQAYEQRDCQILSTLEGPTHQDSPLQLSTRVANQTNLEKTPFCPRGNWIEVSVTCCLDQDLLHQQPCPLKVEVVSLIGELVGDFLRYLLAT